MVIADEVDSALVDHKFPLVGAKGLFLGLTATGLTYSSAAEMGYLADKLGILNISAGAFKNIKQDVVRDSSLEDFFSLSNGKAKLVYLGEESSIFSKRLDQLIA